MFNRGLLACEAVAHMLLACDTAIRFLATPLKAAVARELIVRHGLTQDEVAEMLGVTQAAVSQYTSGVRGRTEGRAVRQTRIVVREFASALVLNQLVSVEFRMELDEPGQDLEGEMRVPRRRPALQR